MRSVVKGNFNVCIFGGGLGRGGDICALKDKRPNPQECRKCADFDLEEVG
ncbi:MAG: hypothetical protein II972_01775 [Elusimicrobiaceae bacterium]|nr:hypothetical protein [Elusimicrobiaceae bacterium]